MPSCNSYDPSSTTSAAAAAAAATFTSGSAPRNNSSNNETILQTDPAGATIKSLFTMLDLRVFQIESTCSVTTGIGCPRGVRVLPRTLQAISNDNNNINNNRNSNSNLRSIIDRALSIVEDVSVEDFLGDINDHPTRSVPFRD
eukprot:jgi/Psemu1/53458/gm1.53458_g